MFEKVPIWINKAKEKFKKKLRNKFLGYSWAPGGQAFHTYTEPEIGQNKIDIHNRFLHEDNSTLTRLNDEYDRLILYFSQTLTNMNKMNKHLKIGLMRFLRIAI